MKLNNLTGKEWLPFTKSWFTINARNRSKSEIQHPAKYPEELVMEFVKFFTNEGEVVLDPFMGVGSTMIGCQNLNRRSVGIELNPEFARVIKEAINEDFSTLYEGDCREKLEYIDDDSIDFIMTSPPYWNILKKKRGHSDSQHNQRAEKDLPLYYSDDNKDLGNIDDYDEFLDELNRIFLQCNRKLKSGKYMTVVIQNFRNDDGRYMTLAWDIAKKISEYMEFCGEKIWFQENKKLGIWGYPTTFILNIHHHYCLIFKKL